MGDGGGRVGDGMVGEGDNGREGDDGEEDSWWEWGVGEREMEECVEEREYENEGEERVKKGRNRGEELYEGVDEIGYVMVREVGDIKG